MRYYWESYGRCLAQLQISISDYVFLYSGPSDNPNSRSQVSPKYYVILLIKPLSILLISSPTRMPGWSLGQVTEIVTELCAYFANFLCDWVLYFIGDSYVAMFLNREQ